MARSHMETGPNSTAEFSSVSKYDQGVRTEKCTLSVNKISHLRPDRQDVYDYPVSICDRACRHNGKRYAHCYMT